MISTLTAPAEPASLEKHAAELRTNGYTIVENILTPEQVQTARDLVEQIFKDEHDLAIERGWRNNRYQVSYMLPQKHELFRQLPLHPTVIGLVRAVMGPKVVMSSFNAMTMMPGGESQELHMDQPDRVPGTVLNINAMYVLDPFTQENGCTRGIPGSQDWAMDTPINKAELEKQVTWLEAPVGSLIAFNGGMLHAGSANKSKNLRRVLHAYYCRSWVRPQWDFARSLTPDIQATLTDEQKRLFGIRNRDARYDAKLNDRIVDVA
jgi:ectoine hydroxylase-related dioxygenase (phytanoyl-CoA dioxygenase family)